MSAGIWGINSHPRCYNCRISEAGHPCDKDHRCRHCYCWKDDLFEATRPKRSYASKSSSSLVSPGTKTSVPSPFSPLCKKPFNINDDHIVRDHLAEKAESSDEESSVFSDRESGQGSEAEGSEDGEFHDFVDSNVIQPVSESIVSVRNTKNSDNKYVVITKVKKRKEKAESTSCSETDTEMMKG